MSFDDVFTPLLARSRQLAYRLLGNDEAARDVASEALTRLFEHWDTLGHDLDHCTAWTCGSPATSPLTHSVGGHASGTFPTTT
jgi:DNA-directed RNA polymerase specialized sigma24 family protein